jgi:hypothetical protein
LTRAGRAIGDRILKPQGVTAEPEIRQWRITPADQYLVLASDGLWYDMCTRQRVAGHADPPHPCRRLCASACPTQGRAVERGGGAVQQLVRRSAGTSSASRVRASCRVVSCRVVSCRVVSCRVVSCRVVSCRVVGVVVGVVVVVVVCCCLLLLGLRRRGDLMQYPCVLVVLVCVCAGCCEATGSRGSRQGQRRQRHVRCR